MLYLESWRTLGSLPWLTDLGYSSRRTCFRALCLHIPQPSSSVSLYSTPMHPDFQCRPFHLPRYFGLLKGILNGDSQLYSEAVRLLWVERQRPQRQGAIKDVIRSQAALAPSARLRGQRKHVCQGLPQNNFYDPVVATVEPAIARVIQQFQAILLPAMRDCIHSCLGGGVTSTSKPLNQTRD